MDEILKVVNEALANVVRKGSNEWKLVRAMMQYPQKYDFGDCGVELKLIISVYYGGYVEISRYRDHSTSEPFRFVLRKGRKWRRLKIEDGAWDWDGEWCIDWIAEIKRRQR